MYIFIFSWVPSLEQVSASSTLPLGYIFSLFMMSMMLGSLVYTIITNRYLPCPATWEPVTALASIVIPSWLGCCAAFCVFEACVGMYYPVQGMLRSVLIPDEHRATVSHSVHTMSCANRYIIYIFIVSHPIEHFRRHLAPHWSICSATSCIYYMFGGACIFLDCHVPKQHETYKSGMPN